ncbi:unnamed protein product, partial [Timema podura]|nr:unnamed protein product [Timema podura]
PSGAGKVIDNKGADTRGQSGRQPTARHTETTWTNWWESLRSQRSLLSHRVCSLLEDYEFQNSKVYLQMESLPTERFKRNVVRTKLDLVVGSRNMASEVKAKLACALLSLLALYYSIHGRHSWIVLGSKSSELHRVHYVFLCAGYTRVGNPSTLMPTFIAQHCQLIRVQETESMACHE